MKKKLMTLLLISLLTSCTSRSAFMEPPSQPQVFDDEGGYDGDYNSPAEVSGLNSLKAGVLPDPKLTQEEEKLAGILIREVKPEFPLKIGILLYQKNSNLSEKVRSKSYENFISKVKANQNIGQVLEISPGLITNGADIEEIRKLGARFQVSQILVVNDSYENPIENKEAILTPIDSITGDRTWESFSSIEVYSLDVLNGVFSFSTSANEKDSQKYNKNSTFENKDKKLVEESANKAWDRIEIKVLQEIDDFKKRISTKTEAEVK